MTGPKENPDHVIEALRNESPNLSVAVEGQEEYEISMKRLFNGNHTNRPRAFVTPKNSNEVCHVLQYASANQLQVSVLGGGHDPKGMLGKLFKLDIWGESFVISCSETAVHLFG